MHMRNLHWMCWISFFSGLLHHIEVLDMFCMSLVPVKQKCGVSNESFWGFPWKTGQNSVCFFLLQNCGVLDGITLTKSYRIPNFDYLMMHVCSSWKYRSIHLNLPKKFSKRTNDYHRITSINSMRISWTKKRSGSVHK